MDGRGTGYTYNECILWMNTASGGIRPGGRFEFNVEQGDAVENCYIHQTLMAHATTSVWIEITLIVLIHFSIRITSRKIRSLRMLCMDRGENFRRLVGWQTRRNFQVWAGF
jgi:hypothetical protein